MVGSRILPTGATRATGLLLIVAGILFLISATTTVAPIWLYGPADPGNASAGSQPDWYTGFLDGALRLVPPGWEFVWLGRTWTLAILVPLAVVTAFLLFVLLYPYLEGWITGDHEEHHLLDRPRNAPTRTAIGVAGIVFYGVLWGAASADLISVQFHVGLEAVVGFLQAAIVIAPTIAFVLTRRICFALQKKDRELLLHGYETGRLVRLPGGEFIEVQKPLDAYEQWRLIDVEDGAPLILRPGPDGKVTWRQRLRFHLARFFFEDRISGPRKRTLESETSPQPLDTTQPVREYLPFVATYRAGRRLGRTGGPHPTRDRHGVWPNDRGRSANSPRMPISRPAVSQHLKVLKDAGLVTERASGTRRIYRLNPTGVGALRDQLDTFWNRALEGYKRSCRTTNQGDIMTETATAVVHQRIVVEAPIERAFTVFTERFGDFKPPEHNLLHSPIAETVFDPRVGGHIYDRAVDGTECHWARSPRLRATRPGRVQLGHRPPMGARGQP